MYIGNGFKGFDVSMKCEMGKKCLIFYSTSEPVDNIVGVAQVQFIVFDSSLIL